MPYVKPERRAALVDAAAEPRNAGELNFCLTWHLVNSPDPRFLQNALWEEVWEYIDAREISYDLFNTVIGALECCRLEFRRRVGVSTTSDLTKEDAIRYVVNRLYRERVAPYEDIKINENGDVY